MHREADDDGGHDGERHDGHLHRHDGLEPVRRLAARRRKNENGDAEPDEGKAERHHDRGQVAQWTSAPTAP